MQANHHEMEKVTLTNCKFGWCKSINIQTIFSYWYSIMKSCSFTKSWRIIFFVIRSMVAWLRSFKPLAQGLYPAVCLMLIPNWFLSPRNSSFANSLPLSMEKTSAAPKRGSHNSIILSTTVSFVLFLIKAALVY